LARVIAAVHTSKFELGILPVAAPEKSGASVHLRSITLLQKIVRCCMCDDGWLRNATPSKRSPEDVRPGQIGHYYGDLVLARKKFGDLFLVFAPGSLLNPESRRAEKNLINRFLRQLRGSRGFWRMYVAGPTCVTWSGKRLARTGGSVSSERCGFCREVRVKGAPAAAINSTSPMVWEISVVPSASR